MVNFISVLDQLIFLILESKIEASSAAITTERAGPVTEEEVIGIVYAHCDKTTLSAME